ncbi:TlpA family protein disulfide reductase [Halanaerobaculum tunisiense]
MKKLIIFFVICLLIISLVIGGVISLFIKFKEGGIANSEEKYQLPEVTLESIGGHQIAFDQLEEPTILFFWLPKSKSCQLQLEKLAQLKKETNHQVQIIAVGIGALSATKIKDIAQRKRVDFPLVIDTKTELTKQLEITAIPALVFYQPYNEPYTEVGLQDKQELTNLIEEHLGGGETAN